MLHGTFAFSNKLFYYVPNNQNSVHGTKHFCIKTKLIFHNKLNWRYSEHLTL
jgi:hypothetical protein